MSDTHINAYFADVDEKQKAFEQAAAELQEARSRLEAKKKEVGYEEPEVTKAEEPDSTEEPKQANPNPFKRK